MPGGSDRPRTERERERERERKNDTERRREVREGGRGRQKVRGQGWAQCLEGLQTDRDKDTEVFGAHSFSFVLTKVEILQGPSLGTPNFTESFCPSGRADTFCTPRVASGGLAAVVIQAEQV